MLTYSLRPCGMLHIGDLETLYFKVTFQIHLSCRVPGGPRRSMGVPSGTELCRMTGLTWRDHVERTGCEASRWWAGTAPPLLPRLLSWKLTRCPQLREDNVSHHWRMLTERIAHSMAKCSQRVWRNQYPWFSIRRRHFDVHFFENESRLDKSLLQMVQSSKHRVVLCLHTTSCDVVCYLPNYIKWFLGI